MDNLVAEHPNLVSKLTIGYSFEKRPMNVLKVHRLRRGFFLSMLLESCSSQAGCHSRLCLQIIPPIPRPPNRSLLVLSLHLPTTPTPFFFCFLRKLTQVCRSELMCSS